MMYIPIIIPYIAKPVTSLYLLCNSRLLPSNNSIICLVTIVPCSSNLVNENLWHDKLGQVVYIFKHFDAFSLRQ